jgi:hypothetical protein
VKLNRREFSAALLAAATFPGKLLDEFDQSPRRPSMLLLPDDPFSGIGFLKLRLDAGQRPSEDMSGWALSCQLTRKNEFAERAIAAMRASSPKGSASHIWMQVAGLSLAFDWLYEHPALDISLKDSLANRLVDSAAAAERIGHWNPRKADRFRTTLGCARCGKNSGATILKSSSIPTAKTLCLARGG